MKFKLFLNQNCSKFEKSLSRILPGVGDPDILHLSLMLAPSETVRVGLNSDTLGPVAAKKVKLNIEYKFIKE